MLVLKRTPAKESPMQSTSCSAQPTTPTETALHPSTATQVAVSPSALLAAFATVPDPRRRRGTRFTLAAILALAVAAILSNHLSVLAISEWGASQNFSLLRRLGFPHGVTPHQSTLQRLFRRLGPDPLSAALTCYFALSTDGGRARGSQGVAIDGKAQRGRLAFPASGCPVHALSAFLHEQGIVLAQEPIDPAGPSDKAEAELTVAPQLLARLDWQGRVMTGDALFCQRHLCQQVLAANGDYLLEVKENQLTLYNDISLLFDPPKAGLPLDDEREVRTVDHGHGRHHDARHLIASTDLNGYCDWPGLAQVFRLERNWEEQGEHKREVHYGITSLPPAIADAPSLLQLKRGHWQIENALHHVKDVTMDEDRSLVHLGYGPSIMAELRDLALSLIRQSGCRTIASRLRYYSSHPEEAVALLFGHPPENA
jgi:predicted transposase YbfD/YdcC